jgi:hypothetical protein
MIEDNRIEGRNIILGMKMSAITIKDLLKIDRSEEY